MILFNGTSWWRFSFYSWGIDFRIFDGVLVLCWRKRTGRAIYFSPDGTPRQSKWFYGVKNYHF